MQRKKARELCCHTNIFQGSNTSLLTVLCKPFHSTRYSVLSGFQRTIVSRQYFNLIKIHQGIGLLKVYMAFDSTIWFKTETSLMLSFLWWFIITCLRIWPKRWAIWRRKNRKAKDDPEESAMDGCMCKFVGSQQQNHVSA